MGTPKIRFFFQQSSKFKFWLSTKSWNHHSFVNISPTLVIDTSMERSSRVLHHGNPLIRFFQKSSNFDFWRRAEITLDSSIYQSYISNWYINGMVFTSTSPWKPKNVNFFKKLEIDEIEFCPYPEFPYAEKRNRSGFVNISPTLVIDTSTERSSSTTTWEPKIWYFSKNSKLNLTCAEELKSTFK